MGDAEETARREELAAFLRARRDALQPEDIGILRRGRSRVKGLRRHEVADAAAMSLTWYTWLEQGRDIRTSSQVIDSLARALLLDSDGRRHLRRLAGILSTDTDEAPLPAVGDSLVALVEDMLPHPAHLMEPATDLVAWNTAYVRLFADPEGHPEPHRNGLWLQLMDEGIQQRLGGWEHETELAIARFRAESAKYPGDARFEELVDELMQASPFFRQAWVQHQVHRFSGHEEVITHPDVGVLRARLVQLRPLDHPHLTLMVHQLADEPSRAAMESLLAQDPVPSVRRTEADPSAATAAAG